MIFQEFIPFWKSQNEHTLRSMHVIKIPTGLLKLVLTSFENGTSLPDPLAREPRRLHDAQGVRPYLLSCEMRKVQKDYSNTLEAKGLEEGQNGLFPPSLFV